MVSETLLKKLKDKDPAKRGKALDQIAKKPHPDVLACLIEALDDSIEPIRVQARSLLRSMVGLDLGSRRTDWASWWKTYGARACQSCGRWLFSARHYYRVKADVTSEPRELILSEGDLERDHQAEIDRICRELAENPQESPEEEVWVRLDYYLCNACKQTYVKEIRRPPGGAPRGRKR